MRKNWKRILAAVLAAGMIFGDSSLVYAAESTQSVVDTSVVEESGDEILDDEIIEEDVVLEDVAEENLEEETTTEEETGVETTDEDVTTETGKDTENTENPDTGELPEETEETNEESTLPEKTVEEDIAESEFPENVDNNDVETETIEKESSEELVISEKSDVNEFNSSSLNWIELNETFSTGVLEEDEYTYSEKFYFQPEKTGNYGFKGIGGWYAYLGTVENDSWKDIEKVNGYYKAGADSETVESYYTLEAGNVYEIRVSQWLEEGESREFSFVEDTEGDIAEALTINGDAATLSPGEMKIFKLVNTEPCLFMSYSTGDVDVDLLNGLYGYTTWSDRGLFAIKGSDTIYISLKSNSDNEENIEVTFAAPTPVELNLEDTPRLAVDTDEVAIVELIPEAEQTYYIKYPTDVEMLALDSDNNVLKRFSYEYIEGIGETDWISFTAPKELARLQLIGWGLNGGEEFYVTDLEGFENDQDNAYETSEFVLRLDEEVGFSNGPDEWDYSETYYFKPEETGYYYLDDPNSVFYVSYTNPWEDVIYILPESATETWNTRTAYKMEADVTYAVRIEGWLPADTDSSFVWRKSSQEMPQALELDGEDVNISANTPYIFRLDSSEVTEGVLRMSAEGDVSINNAYTWYETTDGFSKEIAIILSESSDTYVAVKAYSDATISWSSLPTTTVKTGDTITLPANSIGYYKLDITTNKVYDLSITATHGTIITRESGDTDVEEVYGAYAEELTAWSGIEEILVVLQSYEQPAELKFNAGYGNYRTVELELNKDYSSGINNDESRYYYDQYYFTPEVNGYYGFTGDADDVDVRDSDNITIKASYIKKDILTEVEYYFYLEAGKTYYLNASVDVEVGEEDIYRFVQDEDGDTSTEIHVDDATVSLSEGQSKLFRIEAEESAFVNVVTTGSCETSWYNTEGVWDVTAFIQKGGSYYLFVNAYEDMEVSVKSIEMEKLTLDVERELPTDRNGCYEFEAEPNTTYFVKSECISTVVALDTDGKRTNINWNNYYDSNGESWIRISTETKCDKILIFAWFNDIDVANSKKICISKQNNIENTLTSWSGTVTVPANSSIQVQYQGEYCGDYFIEEAYDMMWEWYDADVEELYVGEGICLKDEIEVLDDVSYRGLQMSRWISRSQAVVLPEKAEFAIEIRNNMSEDLVLVLRTNEAFEAWELEDISQAGLNTSYEQYDSGENFVYYTYTPDTTEFYHITYCDWLYRLRDRAAFNNCDVVLEAGETYLFRRYRAQRVQHEVPTKVSGTETKFVSGSRVQEFIPTVSGDYNIDVSGKLKLWNTEKNCFEDVTSKDQIALTANESYIFWSYEDGRIGLNSEVTILDYDYYQALIASGGSVSIVDGDLQITKPENILFTLKEVILSLFGLGTYGQQPKEDYVKANLEWVSDEGSFAPVTYYKLSEKGKLADCAEDTVTSGDVLVVKYEPEIVWVDSMTLTANPTTISIDETTKISVEAKPATSKYGFKEEPKFRFESENPSIATVDENGIVTPVSAGEVLINVYADEELRYKEGLEDLILMESIEITVGSSYEVTLETYGGTVNSGNLLKYTAGLETALPTDVTRKEYTFAGWYDNADFTGTPVTVIGADESGDKEFYAKWVPKEYAISYELNEGTFESEVEAPETYTIETETFELGKPVRTGYSFAGWYTKANFDAKTEVSEIAKGSTGDKTFYAKWKLDTYTIEYEGIENATFEVSSPNSYNYEKTVKLQEPVRLGYKFAGWYLDPEFTESSPIYTEITEKTFAEDLTFYAKWDWDVTFQAAINEELLDIVTDEDGYQTIVLSYDAESDSYNSADVNVILTAKQNDQMIHIPANEVSMVLYKNGEQYGDEISGYDFKITDEEAGDAIYTAVVKLDYADLEELIEVPIEGFKVVKGKQPLPVNPEGEWKGISNLGTDATFTSIKDQIRKSLLKDTVLENEELYNSGTITFKNVENEDTAVKSGTYTVVYSVGDIEDSPYFESAEATIQITYNKFTAAGVAYDALYEEEITTDVDRIYDAGAIAKPIEVNGASINTTPYVSGVIITPQFSTPWGQLGADELEKHGYEVNVTANTVSGLSIEPTDDGKSVQVEASAIPSKTANKTIKLTSVITLLAEEGVDPETQPKVSIVTTIKNFKVYNGGSNAMKTIEYALDGDVFKKLNTESEASSYILEKNSAKRTFTVDVKATDYEGNTFGLLTEDETSADYSLKGKLTWKTSNKNVVAVSVNKNTGIPTLTIPKNAQGVTEITATANDAGKSQISFRIVVADTNVRLETTKVSINSKASVGAWADGEPSEGEWGTIYLYPNIMAMDMYGIEPMNMYGIKAQDDSVVTKPTVDVILTDKNGNVVTDGIFEIDDSKVASDGKLMIRFNSPQNSKKNHTIYLKVTQTFPSGLEVVKEKIKITVADKWSAPTLSGKASASYNTALGSEYGYAEVLVTTTGKLANPETDLILADGSPFEISGKPEFVGDTKSGAQYRVRLVFNKNLSEDMIAEYVPAVNETKKVNVKFVAAFEDYRIKVSTKSIAITLTNVRPDFKLSTDQFKNPVFYKDVNFKQMKVYIDVPEGMTMDGTTVALTSNAAKYFNIVGEPTYNLEKGKIEVIVITKTTSNASIQFTIRNDKFYKGGTTSKSLKTSGRNLASETITLNDKTTMQKAAKSFTFYQSQLGKESISLQAESNYLNQILSVNEGTQIISVAAANSAATKLLNKQALVVREDGTNGVRITATKDAFGTKSTSCKLKIFMSISDGTKTKTTKSQIITITFNPKAYDPAVTLKASGNLNAANVNSAIVVKPTWKYMPTGYSIEEVNFTNVSDEKLFELTKGILGAVNVSPADGAKIPSGKNKVGITYDIRTASGELFKVSNYVTINVVQTAKVKASTSAITLYNSVMGEAYGKTVEFSETKVKAPITVEITNKTELENAGIGIDLVNEDTPSENVKYKVYVDEDLNRGQEKTYTVKAKVSLYNSATKKGNPITYNVSFKVKLAK